MLTIDGKLEVATATADIGTGTYTILTQIGADALGLRMADVTARIGDSSLPKSPVEGGSWAAASAGSAVQAACHAVRAKLLEYARGIDNSPLANAALEHVTFAGGRIALTGEPARAVTFAQAMQAGGVDRIEAEESAGPDKGVKAKLRRLHPLGDLRRGEGRRGSGRRAGHAHRQCGGRRQDPEPEDGAQPDPGRRGHGARHGARRRRR